METINRISVVVPVFNTPPFFLKKCFDSICNQTYENIEILVVDSSDSEATISFIHNYLKKDRRFVLINSEKGVSLQRNNGINYATGNLVAFVDSDDYISNTYFETLLKTMSESNADIVFPQLVKETYVDNKVVEKVILETRPVNELIDKSNFFVGTEKNRLVNPVKLYKRSLIGETRFRIDLSHGEDMIFNYELSEKGYRAVFCNQATYIFSAIKGNNAALKRLSKTSINIVSVMYKLLKSNKNNINENYEGMYFQFSYLFNSYFYAFVKTNNTIWLIRFLKYRFFYLKRNHSPKDLAYLLFPYTRKFLKKIFRRK